MPITLSRRTCRCSWHFELILFVIWLIWKQHSNFPPAIKKEANGACPNHQYEHNNAYLDSSNLWKCDTKKRRRKLHIVIIKQQHDDTQIGLKSNNKIMFSISCRVSEWFQLNFKSLLRSGQYTARLNWFAMCAAALLSMCMCVENSPLEVNVLLHSLNDSHLWSVDRSMVEGRWRRCHPLESLVVAMYVVTLLKKVDTKTQSDEYWISHACVFYSVWWWKWLSTLFDMQHCAHQSYLVSEIESADCETCVHSRWPSPWPDTVCLKSILEAQPPRFFPIRQQRPCNLISLNYLLLVNLRDKTNVRGWGVKFEIFFWNRITSFWY